MKAKHLYLLLPALVAVGLLLAYPRGDERATTQPTSEPVTEVVTYWTGPGLEPDTCVAAWLLTRHVTPGANVVFAESLSTGIPFDVPGCELQRQPGQAASEVVFKKFQLDDPFAARVVAVVREIELMPWTTNDDPFFITVRAGLAEAVNLSDSDTDCLRAAMAFLDDLRQRHTDPA